MRYRALKALKDEEFKRLTGVRRSTFEKMLNILVGAESQKKNTGGKPRSCRHIAQDTAKS